VQERVDADHQKDLEEKETMAAGGLTQKGLKKQKTGRSGGAASGNTSSMAFGGIGNIGSNWGGAYSGKDYGMGGFNMGEKGGKGDMS
jgi:hypothetical protein